MLLDKFLYNISHLQELEKGQQIYLVYLSKNQITELKILRMKG